MVRPLAGQDLDAQHTKKIPLADTMSIDTLSLVPGSVTLEGVDTAFYTIDYAASKIYWKSKTRPDSLSVSYRVYPVNFVKPAQHKDISLLRKDPSRPRDPFTFDVNAKKPGDDPFKMDGLTKSGSLSRGIAFGNAQDVAVNSNLNLQLSGKITDNVELLMAASDDNIPIQPEGTTQQLQEFDKVFIQLSSKQSKLIAGDFFLTRPDSRFMNFNKRAQGLFASTTVLQPTGKNGETDTTKLPRLNLRAAAAVSRGKFARNVIQGIEGNQGPYRLRGAENESFIVVLAGTERIFIDGQLLKRGQEYDYVIDYNTAEVTFTARQLITKDKRITAEFQYSDRNYARSLITTGADWKSERAGLRFNFYSEQDSKNQPLQQQLTSADKLLLASVGDTLNAAVVPSADSIPFNNNEVLYKKRDTLVNSVLYTGVYIYSTNADSARWRVAFSNVGQGNGDYVQINSSANGKVFQWVAPVGNVRQGSYAPVILLVTPKQRRMVTGAFDYALNKHTAFTLEGALSENDLNTFSRFNDDDNRGYGSGITITNHRAFGDSLPLELKTTIGYELVTKLFTPIERFRPVEFERDWNLGSPARTATADQHLATAGLQLTKKNQGTAGYRFALFREGAAFTGGRHEGNLGWKKNGFTVVANGSFLQSAGDLGKTNFIRSKADVSQKIGFVVIGAREDLEQNYVNRPASDSLQGISAAYLEWQGYLRSADTTKRSWNLYYKERTDRLPSTFNLIEAAHARTAGFSFDWLANPNQQFRTTVGYRELEITAPQLTSQQPDNSLVGRIEYTLRAWKGAVTASTFYETGSGLEVKKEFSYIEVAPGQGYYAWTDYNNNSVKELNEFDVALFPDQARYIRVYVPTGEYVRVYTNQFSQSLGLRPASKWTSPTGVKKIVALFSDQASYRVDRKTSNGSDGAPYNPFLNATEDSSLVTLNATLRNTVFFNQLGSKFGIDYSVQDVRGKNLLTNGYESRTQAFQEIRLRWNFTKAVGMTATWRNGTKSSSSQYFSSRNFRIAYYEAEPKWSWQPGTSFRLTVGGRYAQKENAPDLGGQKCEVRKAGVEVKYNILSKGSLAAEFNLVQMVFNDLESSPVAYEMLEGLKAGQNYTWKLNWQRSLANNMQLNIGYEGRSSENVRAIHTGTASVRAFF